MCLKGLTSLAIIQGGLRLSFLTREHSGGAIGPHGDTHRNSTYTGYLDFYLLR
jgi:hypothetical protein